MLEGYKDYYMDINGQLGNIIEKSLDEKNIMQHARMSNFIDDYSEWINILKNDYEVGIYREALSEYRAMLLFGVMGLYKYAFMALRGYLELTLFAIKLSISEYDFRLWKLEQLDVSWSQIIDEENGLFSRKYIQAFQESFWDDAQAMKQLARIAYRECSEHIHSNYGAITFLPERTEYTREVFEKLMNVADSINQVITYSLSIRYLDKILKNNKLIDFENCIMDNIGYLKCVQELYK